MLIELQEPFKSSWVKGYLVNDGDGRQRVVLYNSKNNISGMTYARYLKCVELGYILPTELEVDHKDNDKSNDDPNNLQILTKSENIAKENLRYFEEEQIHYGYYCAYCENPFLLTPSEKSSRLAKNIELAFCSRRCAAMSHSKITDIDIQKIKSLRSNGYSSYKIAEITGFARNTVMKYW